MDLQIMLTTPRTKKYTPQNKQIIEDYIEVIIGSRRTKL